MRIITEDTKEAFTQALAFYGAIPEQDRIPSITASILKTVEHLSNGGDPAAIANGVELLMRVAAYFYLESFVKARESASSWYHTTPKDFFGSGCVH